MNKQTEELLGIFTEKISRYRRIEDKPRGMAIILLQACKDAGLEFLTLKGDMPDQIIPIDLEAQHEQRRD